MRVRVPRSRLLSASAAIAMGIMISVPFKTTAQGADMDASTVEQQKETSRKSIQWWDSNFKIDPDSLFAQGYINHQEPIAASDGEKGVTLDELKKILVSYHSAFPGTKVEIQMQLVDGNRVATHWTFTGVQKSEYEGLAPTNKTAKWAGISIDEYDANGKIKATWVVWDKFTLFRTLGLVK